MHAILINRYVYVNYCCFYASSKFLLHSKSELQELAEICKKHNVMVLSDEIYGLLSFDVVPGENYRSLVYQFYFLWNMQFCFLEKLQRFLVFVNGRCLS